MSCEKYKSRILDFALGAEEADVRAHLDACPSCRAELGAQRALLEKIDRGVAALVSGEPSGDFAAHVRRRIAENAHAPRPWFAGWMPVTAAALALVVLVGVLTIGRPPRPPQSVQQTPPALIAPAEKPREIAPPESTRAATAPSVKLGPRQPRPPQSAANREPEVLVPRGESLAVARLLNASWSGKSDGPSLTAQSESISDALRPLAIKELKIPTLQVAPLESGDSSKGFTQK